MNYLLASIIEHMKHCSIVWVSLALLLAGCGDGTSAGRTAPGGPPQTANPPRDATPIGLASAKWTKHLVEEKIDLCSIAWSGKEYVAIGNMGIVVRSEDLHRWTGTSPATGAFLTTVAWLESRFLIGGNGVLWTSPDGVAWTDCKIDSNLPVYGFASSQSQFVAVCAGGKVLTSRDGKNWTASTDGVVSGDIHRFSPVAVAASGGMFVAVGQAQIGDRSFSVSGGAIMTSTDGVGWTLGKPLREMVADVVWTGTQFAAVRTDGVLMVSQDGLAWSDLKLPVDFAMGLVWTGGEYVVGAKDGVVLTGRDGNWTEHRPGFNRTATRVAWTGTKVLVPVGDSVFEAAP